MKRKIVPPIESHVIDSCMYCYHYFHGFLGGEKCGLTKKVTPEDGSIPDWCPLEDAKEVEGDRPMS